MNILNKFFVKLSNIGIYTDSIENQFIKSSNRAAIIASALSFPYIIIYLVIDNIFMTAVNASFFLLYPIALLLNAKHHYLLAKISLVVLGYLHVTIVSIYYGRITGFELYFYLMPIISIFVFSRKEQKTMLAGISLFIPFFFLTQYLYTVITPYSLSQEIAQILYYSSVIFILLFIMIFSYIFKISSLTFQEDLEEQKKSAQQANKSKSLFLANMSHEIRTPMNAIIGFVEQLSKNETDKERQKYFNIVKNSTKTLLNIINDILDFSKIESGKMDIEEQDFLLNEFMEESIVLFTKQMEEKKLNFIYEPSQELPKKISTDIVRLKQILFNLLSNAIKFTPNKGTISLNIKYLQENSSILFSVTDTGIGIAEDNQEKIFNAFDQEDNSTTRRFGGTGLGLSISSKLVSLMGGELEVKSVLDQGSTFYFTIPHSEGIQQITTNNQQVNTNSQEIEFRNKKFANMHILIVEDNKTNQILLSIILDELDISYDIANDGIQGIDMYQNTFYDTIFMDENMPNMNGIEATKQIRQIQQNNNLVHTPIISVTANALSIDRQRFLDAGADEYISKPYTEEDIKFTLEKLLI